VSKDAEPEDESGGRVTISDVARHVGVSIALVSLALNDKGRVSEKTRDRIKAAAHELGYEPSRAAAFLRTGRSHRIGFLLAANEERDWSEQWYSMTSQILMDAVNVATRLGYSVTVLTNSPSKNAIAELDGLVVSDSLTTDKSIATAAAVGVPVMTNERPDDSMVAVNLDSGYRAMTRAALDHLRQRGAKQPALLTEPLGLYSNELAEREYRAWCAESALEPIVARGHHDRSDLIDRVNDLLATDCDAIYSFYEEGPEIQAHIRSCGLRVPEDIALVAAAPYSDEINREAGVSTTVYHPDHMVDAPLTALVDVIEGRATPPLTVNTPWEFVIHASS
jgi:DNA-binding LacI/PurR family transcriptional regulator